jgi:hypothetical protein
MVNLDSVETALMLVPGVRRGLTKLNGEGLACPDIEEGAVRNRLWHKPG